MSLQAMVWALEEAPDVPPNCVATLSGLANHAGRDGRNAYPSVELLGHYARKGGRVVQKDLRTLEDLGLIRRGDQRAAYDIPERYRPTVWDLAMERKRPDYRPARFRHTESPSDRADRGGPEATPDAGRGEPQDAGGVTCSSPEPLSKPSSEQLSTTDLRSPGDKINGNVSPGGGGSPAAPGDTTTETNRCRLCDHKGHMVDPPHLPCEHDQRANTRKVAAHGEYLEARAALARAHPPRQPAPPRRGRGASTGPVGPPR